MDGELHFQIQGSGPAPFMVRFRRAGDHLYATCTCNAGLLGKLCKHRLGLMKGEPAGILSGNVAQVAQIPSLFEGTSGEVLLRDLLSAEARLTDAHEAFTQSKLAFLETVRT